jgi:predicted transcriptional regulator
MLPLRYYEQFMRTTDAAKPGVLGPLEIQVMETLWQRGKSTVRVVVTRLDRSLAYTTVMTTLDRLYKQGMLERHEIDRAYSYWPRWSREEWDQKRAGDLVNDFLAGPNSSAGSLLVSYLVDAVGEQDLALLDEMEEKIRIKRREAERNSGT